MVQDSIRRSIGNALLWVHVHPNKQQTKVVAWDAAAQRLDVAIAAPRDKGKANAELLHSSSGFSAGR